MKALAIQQFNKNPEQLSQLLERDEFLLITEQEQPLGIVIPFSSDVFKRLLNIEQQRLDGKTAVRELEKAYRDAAQEFDTNWEITASDGLTNETW